MAETENKKNRVKVIPINTNKEKFFLEYLMIQKPALNYLIKKLNNGLLINKKPPELHDMPMKVLARLLYYNDIYKDLPEDIRFKTVFDYNTKQKIMEDLGISEDNLNAYFSQLRKIRILDGRKINPFFIVNPETSDYQVVFEFTIHEK